MQNKCAANEMFLWHGTGETHPQLISHGNKGFSTNYVSENKDVKNFWGRAIYFAEQAYYSCAYYGHRDQETGCKVVLYVKVLVGKPYKMESEPNSTESIRDENLRDPPVGFDSV